MERTGVRRKPTKSGRRIGAKKSRRDKTKKSPLPRTAVLHSRKSVARIKMSRANSAMSLTELQFLAKDRGIPFGGLTRIKLIKKINNYM